MRIEESNKSEGAATGVCVGNLEDVCRVVQEVCEVSWDSASRGDGGSAS